MHTLLLHRFDSKLAEMLMSRVEYDTNGGCWLWCGNADLTSGRNYGRGTVRLNGRTERVYRVSYRVFVGEIPSGALICHRCDVPSCINPQHLFPGTHAENTADMMRKGRGAFSSFDMASRVGKLGGRSLRNRARGERCPRAKLTDDEVREIRALNGALSMGAVGRKFGISPVNVRYIWQRKTWRHVT